MKTSKIIATIVAVVILGACLWWVYSAQQANSSGTIEVIVIDDKQNIIIQDYLDFNTKDTLRSILEKKYDIVIEQGFLVKFENVEAYDTTQAFIKIWINCRASVRGINQIRLVDQDVIHFVYTNIGDYRAPC